MFADRAVTRRAFLKTGVAVGGGLLLGYALPDGSVRTWAADAKSNPLDVWIHIRPDNTMTLMVPSSEMGQGSNTALPMLIAEELEADWSKVSMELAEGNPVYANPSFGTQSTGGSRSILGFSEPLRKVGAAARTMLVAAAAQEWNVPAGDCRAENGTVLGPAGRKATFGALASAAARMPVPSDVPLKPPSQWKIAGQPVKRLDTFSKATGRAKYGLDVQVPGMLVGALMVAPTFGGKLRHVAPEPALAVKGVKAVVPLTGHPTLDDAVVVVADGYWHAKKGLAALDIQWDAGPHGALNDETLWTTFRAGLQEPGANAVDQGGAPAAISGAAKKVQAQFEVPYLAHATMEPMNATAHVTAEGVEIWAPTQSPGRAQTVVAQLLGLKPEQIKVHVTYLGGGYGRRGEQDFVVRAVLTSKAVGAPVKVQYSREDDMRHGTFRPATLVRLESGVDASGKVVGILGKVVNSSIRARTAPQVLKGGLDPTAVQGIADTPYGFPARKFDYVMKNMPVTVGVWRSVASSYSGFVMEAFMDELAHAAGQDPVRFRLALLSAKPRHAAVLEQVAAMARWGASLPTGWARGVAVHESYGTIVGEVAEVSLQGRSYKVHKVHCVVDCGLYINPDTVTAQMQSSIVYGLTAAQYGEINLENGGVKQGNFPEYQMLKLAQMPAIAVHVMKNEHPHGGVGEPGTPPIAPAISNALFVLTGQRVRSLPLMKHGFELV